MLVPHDNHKSRIPLTCMFEAVTPLDLVKCRRQVDSKIYSSNISAWRTIYKAEGLRGVFFGWSPTFVGYSFQGAGKYGFYEVFKYAYGDKMFPNANKTVVYLAASASAEFLADIALCPLEAIKVRMQTTIPPFASTLREGWGKVTAKEGIGGLYKGLYPLWGRQIPYTMVKFATFETTVNYIYATLGKPKESYNTLQQTGVSFLGGYIAGIGCAVISHPADVMVSKLNADRQRMYFPCDLRSVHERDPGALTRIHSRRGRWESHVQDLRQHRIQRPLERLTSANRHDWHPYRVPMAHL